MATAAQTSYWGNLLANQGIVDPRVTGRPVNTRTGQRDPHADWPDDPSMRQPKLTRQQKAHDPGSTPALRSVPRLAAHNFLPDLADIGGGILSGLTHADLQAGRFLADPKTPWWYKAAVPAIMGAQAFQRAVLPGVGPPGANPTYRQAGEMAQRWVSQPGEPLGSQAKRTLAYTPAQASADASLMFAPEEGYASALADAAKAPGFGGAALRTGLQAGNMARKVVNPLEGVPAVAASAGRAGQRFARTAGLIDRKSGLLTPEGLRQVQQMGASATPGLKATDWADPRVQRSVVATIRNRGLTPESLKESVLHYNGAPPVRGPITGVAPPGAKAMRQTQGLIDQGRDAVDARVKGIVTPPKSIGTPTADDIRGVTEGPDAARLGLTDPETTDLRMAAQGHDVLNTPMDPETKLSMLGRFAKTGAKLAAGAAAGYAAPHVLPILHALPGGELTSSVFGAGAEALLDQYGAARAAAKAGEAVSGGAPAIGRSLQTPIDIAQSYATKGATMPYAQAMIPKPPPPPPEEQPQPDPNEVTTPSAIEFGTGDPVPDAPAADAKPPPKGSFNDWPDDPAMHATAKPETKPEAKPEAPAEDDSPSHIQFADGGEVMGYADGGQVVSMSEALLRRAEQAHKAAQASTKPLLGLSDATVAQALRVASRGI